jgi:hypothetical protein
VRAGIICGVLAALPFAGCTHKPSRLPVDPATARKLGDSFMSDLIAHHADQALDKMEPEFIKTMKRSDFAPQLEKLFQYCGWPQDSELKDDQVGMKIYRDEHTNPMQKFIYAAATNHCIKGHSYFSVEIAPSGAALKVTSFGPLIVTSGNPYP